VPERPRDPCRWDPCRWATYQLAPCRSAPYQLGPCRSTESRPPGAAAPVDGRAYLPQRQRLQAQGLTPLRSPISSLASPFHSVSLRTLREPLSVGACILFWTAIPVLKCNIEIFLRRSLKNIPQVMTTLHHQTELID